MKSRKSETPVTVPNLDIDVVVACELLASTSFGSETLMTILDAAENDSRALEKLFDIAQMFIIEVIKTSEAEGWEATREQLEQRLKDELESLRPVWAADRQADLLLHVWSPSDVQIMELLTASPDPACSLSVVVKVLQQLHRRHAAHREVPWLDFMEGTFEMFKE